MTWILSRTTTAALQRVCFVVSITKSSTLRVSWCEWSKGVCLMLQLIYGAHLQISAVI